MTTKYTSIIDKAPTFADPGQKGARNVDLIKKTFPSPFTNPGKAGGNFPATVDGEKRDALVVNFSSEEAYKEWFFINVVNGIVNNGAWMTNTQNPDSAKDEFNMNYIGAPDLQVGDPGFFPIPKDKDGKIVATNYFVPVLVTQADAKTGNFTPGEITEEKLKSSKKTIESKTSFPPGSGGGIISTTNSQRNPAKTSKKQASSTMTLGQYLPAAKK